jgi:hypothetical protein
MAIQRDLDALARKYLDDVLDDQRALGYTPDASEDARAEAEKHTAAALRELSEGVGERRAVAA